jgi:hypothetical protein
VHVGRRPSHNSAGEAPVGRKLHHCSIPKFSASCRRDYARRRFSPRAANCSSWAKTSADTMPWTRLSVGHSSTVACHSVVRYLPAVIAFCAISYPPPPLTIFRCRRRCQRRPSLAVQLARQRRLTLVGFLRERRLVVYAREERIAVTASASVGVPRKSKGGDWLWRFTQAAIARISIDRPPSAGILQHGSR